MSTRRSLRTCATLSADNFTGRRVTGCDSPECVLLSSVAQALARVQKDLRPSGLSLKVYDCYRPERAVRAFVAWARDGRRDGATRRFHPRLAKSQLLAQGYIARKSAHSRGSAVDLTLVRLLPPQVEPFDPARAYGVCTQPQTERSPDSSLDMGTGFDCFDAMSHTGASGLSPRSAGPARLCARQWPATASSTTLANGGTSAW